MPAIDFIADEKAGIDFRPEQPSIDFQPDSPSDPLEKDYQGLSPEERRRKIYGDYLRNRKENIELGGSPSAGAMLPEAMHEQGAAARTAIRPWLEGSAQGKPGGVLEGIRESAASALAAPFDPSVGVPMALTAVAPEVMLPYWAYQGVKDAPEAVAQIVTGETPSEKTQGVLRTAMDVLMARGGLESKPFRLTEEELSKLDRPQRAMPAQALERPDSPLSLAEAEDPIAREGMQPANAQRLAAEPPRHIPPASALLPGRGIVPVPQADFQRASEESDLTKGGGINESKEKGQEEVAPTAAEPTIPSPATPSETPEQPSLAGPGSPSREEFGDPGNPDIYGVAARVRAERAKAGQVAEVPAGQGISAPDSVEQGRAMLASDPQAGEKALTTFEADPNKAVSATGMAAVRAHGERLAFEARRIEEQHGTLSPEYEAAWQKLSEWDKRSKAMQTEWHKTGMAQQGETDIDTGTFTGLQRAFKDATGKDFTEPQAGTARNTAKKVKKAEVEADVAQQTLYAHLDKEASRTQAEKDAQAAVDKQMRDWSVKLAELENKRRVAEEVLKRDVAKIQEDAAAKAATAVSASDRKAVIEAAKAETKARVEQAARDRAIAKVQEDAAKKAKSAVDKQAQQAAIRAAKAATKERVARADESAYAWAKAKEYIEQGINDFNDIRNKLATDMGLPVAKVTEALARDKRAKFLSKEVLLKQQTARLLKQQAKRWVLQAAIPGYLRALQTVPRWLFAAKVGFHGTVALGTHAPTVFFQPLQWGTYVSNFGKMYRMVGSRTYYETQIQDLIRRPNYATANRAGLVNDPFIHEEYAVSPVVGKISAIAPKAAEAINKMTGMGNRGYSVLKMLRQDMFDKEWDSRPKTQQLPEIAQAIADGINHATGVVKGKAPPGSNLALFAPRLMASRVAWLAVDPVKALMSAANWKNASEGERVFAINQIKEKAWVAGTLMGLLALNQGFLSATDSKQKVNFTDPLKSDFLKFKVAGMNVSYGNAMLSMARLPARLYAIRESKGGKLRNLVHPDESTYETLGEYARSQESPFASLASALWFKADWQNRPLPNSNRPVPKRLLAEGVRPYTWPEFLAEQFLPIPLESAAKEVWQDAFGMNKGQIDLARKMMAAISIIAEAGTGGRVTEDKKAK